MASLRGQIAIVTGASSGIGWHTALALARRGCRIVATARRLERLEQLCQIIAAQGGGECLAVPCDVAESAQVGELEQRVRETWGAADILVNNAGRGAYGPFVESNLRELEEVIAVNLLGAINCSRAFLPAMVSRGSGHLVFISSVLGELPAPGHAVYGATKFALNGLAESLYCELAGTGVDVTLVEPGLVRSEFATVSRTPLKRFGQVPSRSPEEVGNAVAGAIAAGRWRCVPDVAGRVAIALRRLFPGPARWVVRHVARRLRDSGAR